MVANEFFDALPVHQLVTTERGWCERMVTHRDGRFVPVPGPLRGSRGQAAPGTVRETSPAGVAMVRQIASLIARKGGAALIIDYGHECSAAGETLQAVAAHEYADPWAEPGERDLTAHVDFQALGEAAAGEGVRVVGPREQGAWLEALGIEVRAETLARAAPERAEEVASARRRLTAPEEMGRLFKTMALVAPGWPQPAGFA
jgi:SAM-dependent MidA family methyltransferase